MNSKNYKNKTFALLGWIFFSCFQPAFADQPIDRIVAVVNEDVITRIELEQRMEIIKKQMRQRGAQPLLTATLRKQVLDDMIQNKLQVQLADANGIRVDSETLNDTIDNIAAQNNMDLAQFRDTLQKDGYSYARFRNDIRSEIAIAQLRRRQIKGRITVTDSEIDNFLSNEKIQGNTNIEVHLAHILIAATKEMEEAEKKQRRLLAERIYKEASQGADFAALARRYSDSAKAADGGDLGWRKVDAIPSLFASSISTMAPGDISRIKKDPSGFHIIKVIEVRTEKPVLLEQVHLRHILIKTDAITIDQDAEKKLQQLKWRIEQGDHFTTLAKAYSEDTTSAIEGGDLGWLELRKLPAALAKAITPLTRQQISDPFKSSSGWHIVQLLDRRQLDSTESVKREQAYAALHKKKFNEAQQEWLKKIRNEAYIKYLPE